MIRLLIIDAALFLLPFALYYVYLRVANAHENEDVWSKKVTSILVVAGAALILISLFAVGVSRDNNTQGTYVPPQFKDGKIVKPRIEPTEVSEDGGE